VIKPDVGKGTPEPRLAAAGPGTCAPCGEKEAQGSAVGACRARVNALSLFCIFFFSLLLSTTCT